MKTALLTLAAGAAIGLHLPAGAQASGSLYDARLGIVKGTSPGIVIIGAGRSASAPTAAASSAAAGTAAMATTAQKAGAGTPATDSAPLAQRLGALLTWGEPPSGQTLNAARRLDSPTLGIALPTAASASQPAAKVPPKPGG